MRYFACFRQSLRALGFRREQTHTLARHRRESGSRRRLRVANIHAQCARRSNTLMPACSRF